MNDDGKNYRKIRQAHWDRVCPQKETASRPGAYYQKLLTSYFQFLIPPDSRVLEIGCGLGDLLAGLNPSLGVGVDFSGAMLNKSRRRHPHLHFVQADAHALPLKTAFDTIILSDLVNDLWDVQTVLEGIRRHAHPGTRVIINFFNNLWRIPLGIANRLGLGADVLEQNWFAPNDVLNLLELAGFEVVDHRQAVLYPLKTKGLNALANQYLVHFWPFSWMALTNIMVARPQPGPEEIEALRNPKVSVIVAARNEAGNVDNILKRIPDLGAETEIIFVEGGSSDNTYETIEKAIETVEGKTCRLYRQPGKGKGDAVRVGFDKATGDILMILDADLTVPPEDLPRFVKVLSSGQGEFVNGVRLVYPMEEKAMRFFNIIGNKFFSMAFSWLLGQAIKDTLCGTKVLYRTDYQKIANNRHYFGDFDPFGDFDLLFGAAKLNLKIVEMPIRYRERTYGDTNISRWRHGWLLLRMVLFAARKIKFI